MQKENEYALFWVTIMLIKLFKQQEYDFITFNLKESGHDEHIAMATPKLWPERGGNSSLIYQCQSGLHESLAAHS